MSSTDDPFPEDRQGAPAPGNDFFADFDKPPARQIQHYASEAAPQSSWGPWHNFFNSMALGLGPRAEAMGQAHGKFLANLLNGVSPHVAATMEPSDYAFNRGLIDQARQDWQKHNPGADVATDLAGAAIPSLATLGTADLGLVRPAARAISRMAPGIAPAIANITAQNTFKGWLARRAIQQGGQALSGAASGGLLAAEQSGESDRPIGEQMSRAALLGGVSNPVMSPLIGSFLSKLSPLTARAMSSLRNLGVNVPIGSADEAPTVTKWLNGLYGDRGAANRQQLTQAAIRTIGSPDTELTSSTIKNNLDRLQNVEYPRLANMAQNADLWRQDQILQHDWQSTLLDAQNNGRISKGGLDALSDVYAQAHGGGQPLDGNAFLQMTKKGSALSKLQTDPEVGPYANEMRDSLNEALERGAQANFGRWVPQAQAGLTGRAVTPWGPGMPPAPGMVWEYDPGTEDMVNELKTANAHYRNTKILEPLVDDTTGQISPQKLAARIGTKAGSPVSNSPSAQPAQPSLDLKSLGEANNFISEATGPDNPSWVQKLLNDKILTGSLATMIGGGAVAAGEHIPGLVSNLPSEALLGGAAVLGGKGANALMNSTGATVPFIDNTGRIINNALAGRTASAIPYFQTLLGPAVKAINYPEDASDAGAAVNQ